MIPVQKSRLLSNLQRYLAVKGWINVEHRNPNLRYYETPKLANGEFESLVLPASAEMSDFDLRIDQVFKQLADLERTSFAAIRLSIIQWDTDTLRARMFRRIDQVNAIPLGMAVTILESLKSFVGSAAYNEFEPRKHVPKVGKIGTDFAANCRFGHTFEGSFGLQIECPLPGVDQLGLDGVEVGAPFERKVMERISIGYSKLHEAVATNSPVPLIEHYDKGFNSNMLKSLVEIFEKLDTYSIVYDILWSPEIRPREEALAMRGVAFDGRAYDIARYAVTELEREDEFEQTTIISNIISLKSENPPDEANQEQFEHTITVHWDREGVRVQLRVPLPSAEYKKACDAHKEGRKITLRGFPQKEGKFWVLTRPSEISFPPR